MLDVFCFHFFLSSILFTFCLQHTTGSTGTVIRVLLLEKSRQTLWARGSRMKWEDHSCLKR